MASFAATATPSVVASSSAAVVQAAPVTPSTMDPTSSDISGPPAIFNEFLKWYEDR